MTIHVAIHHHTEYRYDRLIGVSPQIIRLRPAPHTRTPIVSYSLRISPEKHFINWQQDPFGNYLARVVFPERMERLVVDVDVVAEMTVINPFDFFLEDGCRQFPFRYPDSVRHDLEPYLRVTEDGPVLRKWLAGVPRKPQATVDFLVYLNQMLQSHVGYIIRMEPGVQTCEHTLSTKLGSCRDSGWLLVQILRHLGLAARFVSGYLVQLMPDQKPLEGPAGPTEDFTDLHAWAEVYVPGAGWIGLDPTSGLFAGEGHIPLACSPEPSAAAPIEGSTETCKTEFRYTNKVTRVLEAARVTKPYTDSQWASVMALGDRVDGDLASHDCRLTQGGEPTFVSIDDMEGAEWNTEALGTRKRELASALTRRLRARFAPGGLLHLGVGKWYPGEPLPRWAYSCLWRTDAEPIWREPALFADESRNLGHELPQAERFMSTLLAQLKLRTDTVLPGFEDPYYYLWREATLPLNEDPLKADLKDPLERKRLARLLNRGLEKPSGLVLPIQWVEGLGSDGWQTGVWPLRRERLYLIPGDSPMGLRLPLDSLPWVPATERPLLIPRDPYADLAPLPVMQRMSPQPLSALPSRTGMQMPMKGVPPATGRGIAAKLPPQPFAWQYDPDFVRTALCVEPRDGRLHIFMPPLWNTAAYLMLIAAVEDTAAALDLPVIIEGYLPPSDPRIRHFQITPDPGVIEVNIHPSSGWREVVEKTEILYEEARQCRLGAEKFMLDGRHVGTGGGNHIVLGGATPADSPFLRRPDLVRSLLSYWQHHPSLSYLFAGLFIGPTSQAPRVDEARDDSLYELDIAFQQMSGSMTPQPWMTDRLLRNLLVDVTGNTHRTEFCIDKLYSPDGPIGRRGLVEFRPFEMPPHARMSCVQQLMLRALVARFWQQPYTPRLMRWGTALHDRFMLPHFLWLDFEEVLGEMREAGYHFDADWFLPFFEFRFPRLGSLDSRGIELELRMAIEPWHVLGEEATAGGTARYVDSAVERVQLKVNGLNTERFVIACNGRRVPLRDSGVANQQVAGVRYKAWQPYSALHPTIGIQSPLVFDIVDIAAGRSIGGCTYHVVHPGGRSYDTFPVNAAEAEARRVARFWTHGHSQNALAVPLEETNAEYPFTLDLRRNV